LPIIKCTLSLHDALPISESCNTNSVYMLVNIIEAAQLAKRIKDRVEERLAKNASIQHFKRFIGENIKAELFKYEENVKAKKSPEIGEHTSEVQSRPHLVC